MNKKGDLGRSFSYFLGLIIVIVIIAALNIAAFSAFSQKYELRVGDRSYNIASSNSIMFNEININDTNKLVISEMIYEKDNALYLCCSHNNDGANLL